MDWEFDILYAIQSIRTPFLDKVMAFLSTIGDAGVLWIVIGRYRQIRCEGMSYQPRMSFPQESRPRMSGEPTSSA